MASMIEFVAAVTRFPLASCTCTLMAGEIDSVEMALEGWALKTSWVAAPAVISNSADVAELKPEALATRV